MTAELPSVDRIAEVARLATLLSERVLDALITKRSVTQEEGIALAKAARLMQDHGMEWPPLLTQVVHELAREEEEVSAPETEPSKALTDIVTGGLSRLFSKPRTRTDEQ